MNRRSITILWSVLRRKLAFVLILAISAIGAFATLGDGKIRSSNSKKLLTDKTASSKGAFSLRSGYSFRGSKVIKTQNQRYINLNTSVTYQKGHTTYTVPLKKVILDNKVTFNPNTSTRN